MQKILVIWGTLVYLIWQVDVERDIGGFMCCSRLFWLCFQLQCEEYCCNLLGGSLFLSSRFFNGFWVHWIMLSASVRLLFVCIFLVETKCNWFLSVFSFYLEENNLWCLLFVAVVSLRSFYLLFAVSQLEWLKIGLNSHLCTIQKYRMWLHLSCLHLRCL